MLPRYDYLFPRYGSHALYIQAHTVQRMTKKRTGGTFLHCLNKRLRSAGLQMSGCPKSHSEQCFTIADAAELRNPGGNGEDMAPLHVVVRGCALADIGRLALKTG